MTFPNNTVKKAYLSNLHFLFLAQSLITQSRHVTQHICKITALFVQQRIYTEALVDICCHLAERINGWTEPYDCCCCCRRHHHRIHIICISCPATLSNALKSGHAEFLAICESYIGNYSAITDTYIYN